MRYDIHIRAVTVLLSALCACIPGAPFAEEPALPALTLAEAVARTLADNPALKAARCDIAIAEARQVQASLRKNPELTVEFEDIRLTRGPDAHARSVGIQGGPSGVAITRDKSREQGTAPGLGEIQTTLSLSQLVELGGKRVKRLRVAEKERDVARWDYEVKRIDTLTEVAKAFIEVLHAQERVKFQEASAQNARRAADAVGARVEAGKVSPIELQQARNQAALKNIAVDRERRELETARTKLAAYWGATPDFGQVAGDLYAIASAPPGQVLLADTRNNPDLALWNDEMELRAAALKHQQALRVPDLSAELGFRSLGRRDHRGRSAAFGTDGSWSLSSGETGFDSNAEHSLVLAFSMPLPIFDRNQGGIREAERQADKAAQLKRSAEVQVAAALRAACATLTQAQRAVITLKTEVLPQAEDVLAKAEEGFAQGKFEYADVLHAEQGVNEARAQYAESLRDYHMAVTDVERLSGKPVAGEPDAPK